MIHRKKTGGNIAQNSAADHRNSSRTLPAGRATYYHVSAVVILFVVGVQGLKFVTPSYDYLHLTQTIHACPI
jgi:hypothetical protein